MAIVVLTLDPAEATAQHRLSSIHPPTMATSPAVNELAAQITVGGYVIQNGQPMRDDGAGVKAMTTVYTDAGGITIGTGILTAASANPGADYRWLPQAAYTAVGGGKTRWFPIGGSVTTYPQLQVEKQTAVEDPVIQSNYSYEAHHVRVAYPAYTFNTKGYFSMLTAAGSEVNYTQAAFVMVLVPHAGPGSYYPIYDSGKVSTSGRRFSMIYRKGVIEIWLSGKRVFSHQVLLDHSEPIVIGFSYDAPTKIGRFTCADRRRSSRTFNIATAGGMDFNGYIGAATTNPGVNTPDLTKISDMDILELDVWLNKSLTQHQLESAVNLLATVYRIYV